MRAKNAPTAPLFLCKERINSKKREERGGETESPLLVYCCAEGRAETYRDLFAVGGPALQTEPREVSLVPAYLRGRDGTRLDVTGREGWN